MNQITTTLRESLPRRVYKSLKKIRLIKLAMDASIAALAPKRHKMPEGILNLNPRDPALSSMLMFGVFEPFSTELFRRSLKPGMIVVDIGANIGYYTIIAAGGVGMNGKVIAYEPDTENFDFLQKNISSNGYKNVVVCKQAVSDKSGTAQLFLSSDNKCTHALVKNRDSDDSVAVQSITLDESLRAMEINKADLIKIDIEGAEVLALQGMIETIGRSPELTLFTEFYPQAIKRLKYDPLKYLVTLHNLGFTISLIEENDKKLVPIPPEKFQAFIEKFPKEGEMAVNLLALKSSS